MKVLPIVLLPVVETQVIGKSCFVRETETLWKPLRNSLISSLLLNHQPQYQQHIKSQWLVKCGLLKKRLKRELM